MSFRHPALTARMAAAVDDLSGGRLVLGLGAGWQEREHVNYGFDLLDTPKRFARFEEGLEVILLLLHSNAPVDYSGSYFRLKEAILLPRPIRQNGPSILVGGNGKQRTLPLAARFADEWNAVFIPADRFSHLNIHLDELLRAVGREPGEVRRSLMTGCVLGTDPEDVQRKVQRRTKGKFTADELRQRGLIVGTPAEFCQQLEQLARAGVQRVMLQWLELDDLAGLELLAGEVLPAFH